MGWGGVEVRVWWQRGGGHLGHGRRLLRLEEGLDQAHLVRGRGRVRVRVWLV